MVSKGNNKIAVDADEVANVLRKVTVAHDSPGIPTSSSIVVQSPPTAAAISTFNTGITYYGLGLRAAVDSLRAQLMTLHEDITQTVNQFAARDAAVADEAVAMLSSIDSGATIPVSNSYTPGGSNPADSAAATSGY